MAEKSKEPVITSPEDLMYEGTGQRTPTYDEILDALKFTMEMSPAGDVKNLYEGAKKMGTSPSIEALAQMGEGLVPLAMLATGPVGYGATKGVVKLLDNEIDKIYQDGVNRLVKAYRKHGVRKNDTPSDLGGRTTAALMKIEDNIEQKMLATGADKSKVRELMMKLGPHAKYKLNELEAGGLVTYQEGGPVDLEKYRQLKKINEWQKSQGLKSIDMSAFEEAQTNEVKTPSPSGLSSILRKLGSRIPAVALLGLLSDTTPSKEQFEENLKKLKE